MSKKPQVLLFSYTGVSNLFNPPQSSTSCRRPPLAQLPPTRQSRNLGHHASNDRTHGIDNGDDQLTQRQQQQSRHQHWHQHRRPQHHSTRSGNGSDDLAWPTATPPHAIPTPYQILALRHDEPYTKQRFYALVKLYHPDRHHHHYSSDSSRAIASLPRSTRLERYRLLVAAHTLLSDPAKRRAYDRHGIGWGSSADASTWHSSSSSSSSSSSYSSSSPWPPGHDPMSNATWEDWERWHAGASAPPNPASVPNAAFIALLLALAALATAGRATQASAFAGTVLEQADRAHDEASRELMRARRATGEAGDRNGRVAAFLEHRGAVEAGEGAWERLRRR